MDMLSLKLLTLRLLALKLLLKLLSCKLLTLSLLPRWVTQFMCALLCMLLNKLSLCLLSVLGFKLMFAKPLRQVLR